MNSTYICVIFSVSFVVSLSIGSRLEIPNGNSFLFSNPETMTWHSAMRYCRNNSMQLIDIPSELESSDLLELIKKVEELYKITGSSTGYWTSGSDLAHEGYFYWATNGRAFNFTNWAVGQPTNWRDQEHCVQLRSSDNFKWNDENCYHEYYAICNNHTIFNSFQY